MNERLPLSGLDAMDLHAAQKALDQAIAKRNAAERQVHEARWALEKVRERLGFGSQVSYTGRSNPDIRVDMG